MKKHSPKKRMAALLLSGAMALLPAASYAAAFGTQIEQKNLYMTETTQLTNASWYSSYLNDEIAENYVTYRPGGDVFPVVAYGNDIYGAAGFRTVISYAKNAGQNVIAAINGDYFTMANGVATGMVIKDGIIRTSESSAYTSVGFYEDGTAIIGRSGLQVKFHTAGFGSSGALHLNKALTKTSGIVLYTSDYNDTTKATIPAYNVIIRITEGEPRINQTMRGVIAAQGDSAKAVPIRDGELVLSMAVDTQYPTALEQLRSLQVGEEIEFTFEADSAWNNITYAVGGGEKLLTNGANVAPTAEKTRAPRTAIGIKSDGSVVFYTVDGRQSGYSKGTYLSELAGRMQELGCVEAVNMDGGGSTAMLALYPGDSDNSVINKPSGGSLRTCGNYVLLVSTQPQSGYAQALHLYPYSVTMLAGAKQEFTVKATDSGHYAASVPSGISYGSDSASLGEFGVDNTGNNVFTAGQQATFGTVSAEADGLLGTAEVHVVTEPTAIQLTNSAGTPISGTVAVGTGETYDFGARATYQRRSIVAQDTCFTWTVSGDIGTIDENGVFTADPHASSSGTVTASAGNVSASIAVNVAGRGDCLEDFEGSDPVVESGDFVTYINKELAFVHNGYQSLALTYQFDGQQAAGVLSAPLNLSFDNAPGAVAFWLYGDNSGNEISLTAADDSSTQTISGGIIDFTGWKQIKIPLPADAKKLLSLNLTQKGTESGTLYIDHVMAVYGAYTDTMPPTATLSVEGGALTAHIIDNMDTGISKDDMTVTLDGKEIPFTYDGVSVRADLSVGDGKTHRVSVKVKDTSGNVSRTSLTIEAAGNDGQPFSDTAGHWSNLFDTYLYNQGISSGTKKDGQLLYQPNNNITRVEFAVLIAKWLNLDTQSYSGVELNFADKAQIPAWAEPYVKAVYGRGLMNGSMSDGKLMFGPAKNITRQEAMTVIGHTQERGYAEAEMNFSDSGQVASWALPYVKTLVAQQVISGSNGKLNPTAYVTRGQVASIIFGLN